MKTSLYILLFLVGAIRAHAQDIHFSQFFRSYLNLNPALTGEFDGDYRLNANLRNQWNSVSEPYQTFSFAADAHNLSEQKGVHAGLAFFNDKAGAGELTTSQFTTSIAYSFAINADSNMFVRLGIQPSYVLKSIDFSLLKFDKQFNGISYDPGAASGENFDRNSFSYLNLHSGLAFVYQQNKRKKYLAGIAVFNLLSPKQSFYSENVKLDKRFSIHTGSEYYLTEDIDILPRILYSKQGKFQELVFGSSFRYYLNRTYKKQNLYAGLWYRNKDAIYINLGMDYGNLHFGASYDINVSDLTEATHKKGGFEFSLTYIIKQFHPPTASYRRCIQFL